MIGILLMSHGSMAEGMLDSCKLFFGNDIENIKALCLSADDAPEQFEARITEAMKEVDDGSGVIALCDLMGGTPANRCVNVLASGRRLKVITGVNLAMLIEILSKRLVCSTANEFDIEEMIHIGKESIADLEALIVNMRSLNMDEENMF